MLPSYTPVEPKGFRILVEEPQPDNKTYFQLVLEENEVDAKRFLVPVSVLNTFKQLRNLGFLNELERDYVLFPFAYASEGTRNKYSLVFGGKNDFMGGRLEFQVQHDYILKHEGQPIKDDTITNVKLNNLDRLLKQRFRKYKFIPENGWEFMYYLDFIIGWDREWEFEEIQALDKYKTAGLTMGAVKIMLEKGVPVSEMHHAIGLPISWVEQAYGGAGD